MAGPYMVTLFLGLKEPQYLSPQWLHEFTFLPTAQEGSLFCTSSPAFIIYRHFDNNHSDKCSMILHCSFSSFIEVQFIYNVVLVSAVQQCESVIRIHISTFFLDSFPIQAVTEYRVKFPVLYSSFLLVIYFIYIQMLGFDQASFLKDFLFLLLKINGP